MAIKWSGEACDRYYDPASGGMVTQLTSSPLSNINIYCEQPYTSPDGTRIAILRYADISFDEHAKLLVGDVKRLRIALIDREVIGVFNAAWSGLLHYVTRERRLFRVNLETLENIELVAGSNNDLVGRGGSVSPDQRYVVSSRALPETMAIMVGDLQTGQFEQIFDHPEMVNPHLQFNPVHGKDILVQLNRGSRRTKDGALDKLAGEEGTTHFLIDRKGGNHRALPVGPPYSGSSTGHSSFIADTGRVLVSTAWKLKDWTLDPRTPEGNILSVAPGESAPRVFKAPEHRFNHVSASRCGDFLADSLPGGLYGKKGTLNPWCLVIGNFATGKYRTLVSDCSALGGGGQHTHPHPYLTADNGYAIFNGDSLHGATQVFAAEVPRGFLESLG